MLSGDLSGMKIQTRGGICMLLLLLLLQSRFSCVRFCATP